jgi:hypothetical protein
MICTVTSLGISWAEAKRGTPTTAARHARDTKRRAFGTLGAYNLGWTLETERRDGGRPRG